MEFVLNNPFRVLGLPATASTRDITKRISDLETFAELGKSKSYPHDFPNLGTLDRSQEAIKDAARKIEQAEARLFYSLFWFRAGDSVDELALESIAAGNVNEAGELWDKQLGKKGSKKYTWRLNRGVLRLVIANGKNLNKKLMDEALEDLGFVIDDDLDGSIQDVLSGNESSMDREVLWQRVIDELIELIQSYSSDPYGKNGLRIVESLWSFPSEAREYASSKILNPMIEEINEAIKVSADLRSNDDLEELKKKNRLDKIENLIWDLNEILGEDNLRFQTVANAYADEICSCAVKALNHFKDPKLSLMLIKWALNQPSFSRIKARIEENLETIQSWVDSELDEEIFGEILKKLKVDVYTLTQASVMFEEMRRILGQINNKVGKDDSRYLKISSKCAHRILDFLINTVNSAQKTFEHTKNFTELRNAVDVSARLTRNLLLLDLDTEARSRINENLKTIEGIDNQLTATLSARANHLARSSNIFEQIPGWLWLVGIILLVSMCKGK